ncbi:MAG: hypothetical protein JWM10_3372 [Myxococcaceae bacterium]|nr:hypothetical protein [Myxococcaceae bacterium]
MTATPTDWDGVARAKLTRVLGEDHGTAAMRDALHDAGLSSLTSAADLRRFAEALSARGGYAAAVGALLGVHAAMYAPP